MTDAKVRFEWLRSRLSKHAPMNIALVTSVKEESEERRTDNISSPEEGAGKPTNQPPPPYVSIQTDCLPKYPFSMPEGGTKTSGWCLCLQSCHVTQTVSPPINVPRISNGYHNFFASDQAEVSVSNFSTSNRKLDFGLRPASSWPWGKHVRPFPQISHPQWKLEFRNWWLLQ